VHFDDPGISTQVPLCQFQVPPYAVVAAFLNSMNSARADSASTMYSTWPLEFLKYILMKASVTSTPHYHDQISDLSARPMESRSHPKLGNFNFSAGNTPAPPKSLNPIPPPQKQSNRRIHGNIIHTLPKSMQTTADFNLTIRNLNKNAIGKTGGCISRR
jgi:hypothetical protein